MSSYNIGSITAGDYTHFGDTINNYGVNAAELGKLIAELTKHFPENAGKEDRESFEESVQIIKEEAENPNPKKISLKGALDVLRAIKGSAEFAAAVAGIAAFLSAYL